MPRLAPKDAFVVVGLLSLAYDSNVRCCPKRGSSSLGAARRRKIRELSRRFLEEPSSRVAFHFVLAAVPPQSKLATGALGALQEEHAREGDLLLVNMSEGFLECARKYLLFFDAALPRYPNAQYLVAGDDDNYIQLAHLEADLRLVSQLVPSTGMMLWGLLTWRSYYNNLTMDTSGVGFMGWAPVDWQAARLRLLIDRCASDLERNSINISSRVFKLQMLGATRNASLVRRWSAACARLMVPLRERALLSDMDHTRQQAALSIASRAVDPSPPFPQVNGPCFGVSRALAQRLVEDVRPRRWLERLRETEIARTVVARGGRIPSRMRGSACFPMGDSVFGFWVSDVLRARHEALNIVDSPLFVQHHPWPTYTRGHMSNRSIVLHDLKNPNSSAWSFAARMSSGPFQPTRRTCRTCEDMGWVTWPGSAAVRDGWRCCGKPVVTRELARECRDRVCGHRQSGATL